MSLEALKSVQCPAGDKCNAFRCLFSHPRDAKSTATNSVRASTALPLVSPLKASATSMNSLGGTTLKSVKKRDGRDDGTGDEQTDDAPRRKRARLAGAATSSPEPLSDAGSSPLRGVLKRGAPSATRPLVLAQPRPGTSRAVSAGVSRNIQAASSFTTLARADPPQQPGPSLITTTTTFLLHNGHSILNSSSPLKTATKKVEYLNPRLVKTPSASHDIRLKLVKLLHAEFNRLNSLVKPSGNKTAVAFDAQELIVRALDREEKLAKEKGNLYTSAMKHTVMRYKKMDLAAWLADLEAETEAIKAQERKRAGEQLTNAVHPSVIGPPKVIKTDLTPSQEVAVLKARLLTPIDNLTKLGYIPQAPTQEQVDKARSGLGLARGWEVCDRCGQRFQTFPGRREDGMLASGGRCKHHWGRSYFPTKAPGQISAKPEKMWSCCSTTVGDSPGCTETEHHVFKVSDPARLASVLEFEHTPENDTVPSDRALAFDCEMAYTVLGLELIRLTATAWPTNETVLDILVRPQGEILDLNSTFSGVWPQDMANAELWTSPGLPPVPSLPSTLSAPSTPELTGALRPRMKMASSPAHARALLFSLISPTTPLIGHGLENDLNACRIIHPTIADTVLMYPHHKGLPMRNGLRALVEKHLNRIIQASVGQGHDSAEDAIAAGDLVRVKVGEAWSVMRKGGWKFEGGRLVDPGVLALTVEFIEGAKEHKIQENGEDEVGEEDGWDSGEKGKKQALHKDW